MLSRCAGVSCAVAIFNRYIVPGSLEKGYSAEEIRFFLIRGQYRQRLNFTERGLETAAERLRDIKGIISRLQRKTTKAGRTDAAAGRRVKDIFTSAMDDDLDVRAACEGLHAYLTCLDSNGPSPAGTRGIMESLREIDSVLQVLFTR